MSKRSRNIAPHWIFSDGLTALPPLCGGLLTTTSDLYIVIPMPIHARFAALVSVASAAMLARLRRKPAGLGAAVGRGNDSESAPGVHIYVSDETGGNVLIVDPREGTAGGEDRRWQAATRHQVVRGRSATLRRAVGIANRRTRRGRVGAAAADQSADGIGVVDLATRSVVRKLKSGQDPESFALSPDGEQSVYFRTERSEMSVLDVASGDVTRRVKVGEEPEGVTVRPDGREVYVTSEGDNAVSRSTLRATPSSPRWRPPRDRARWCSRRMEPPRSSQMKMAAPSR